MRRNKGERDHRRGWGGERKNKPRVDEEADGGKKTEGKIRERTGDGRREGEEKEGPRSASEGDG